MSHNDVSCQECRYFHVLKHNFEKGKGYTESYCCDVMLHVDKQDVGWVQEAKPNDRCELFSDWRNQFCEGVSEWKNT